MNIPQLSLSAFPSELLCIITSNLSIEPLIRLIQSGDVILRAKLFTGGVNEVTTTITPPLRFLALFPKLTGWKHIHKISASFYDRDFARKLLQILTPCLQNLNISYHLPKIDLDSLFPNLRHLSIDSLHPDWNSNSHNVWTMPLLTFKAQNLSPDSLALLPVSLTSLEFGCMRIVWSTQKLWLKKHTLNRLINLKRLSISKTPPPLSFIPPWLTDLQLIYSSFFNSADWKSIPPRLTRFHLDSEQAYFTPDELAMFLPPSVTQLVLHLAHPLTEEHLIALPQSLKLLSTMSKTGICQPLLGQAEALPQSIETLQISRSNLPPICTLLPNLKHLTLVDSHCTHYPRSLTTLEKVKVSYSDFVSLPSTLTRLTMALTIPYGYSTSKKVANHMDTAAQPGLPDGILELEIEASVPLHWQTWLPKKLKYLLFEEVDPIDEPYMPAVDWLANMPKSLQDLEIQLSYSLLNNTHIEPLLSHPSLQRMSILATTTALDINCFCNLPRNLESLDMAIMTTVSTPEPFSQLPPKIRTLKLRTLNRALFYLPVEVLNALPLKLRHFNVPTGITSQTSWKTLSKQLGILYDIAIP